MQRRRFLKTSLACGTGLLAGGASQLEASLRFHGNAVAKVSGNKPQLNPFLDPLPIPTALPASNFYHITMTEVSRKLHSQLPPTRVWTYNDNFIGTMINAYRGQPITVRWENNLPSTHLFDAAIDRTLHGSEPGTPDVRTVVHLHGAKVLPQFDGFPESWFTNSKTNVNGPNYRDNQYPNDQPSTQLWFHDHALGNTRLNVYAGLIGSYFIRDVQEQSLGLPMGAPYEVPLVIMDRYFARRTTGNSNAFTGDMLYDCPATPAPDPDFEAAGVTPHHPIWATELWADTPLVNGVVMPYLDVEPRVYRFRTLNACNARFLNLSFFNQDTGNLTPFQLIGTDQGLLRVPVTLTTLLKGNAERHDILIDFSGMVGQEIIMLNDAPAPYPDGGGAAPLLQIMKFRVGKKLNGRSFVVPSTLLNAEPLAALMAAPVARVRDVALDEIEDDATDETRFPALGDDPAWEGANETGSPVIGLLELKHWKDATSILPQVGTAEIWRFVNATGDTHPIHVHLVEFQVLDRQGFDTDQFVATRTVSFTDPTTGNPFPVTAPDADEVNAPKDVVRCPPGVVTRIKMKFDLPQGTVTTAGQHFKYVLHCHILEHEDNEMMRPFEVVA
jgi:spore coat protein A